MNQKTIEKIKHWTRFAGLYSLISLVCLLSGNIVMVVMGFLLVTIPLATFVLLWANLEYHKYSYFEDQK